MNYYFPFSFLSASSILRFCIFSCSLITVRLPAKHRPKLIRNPSHASHISTGNQPNTTVHTATAPTMHKSIPAIRSVMDISLMNLSVQKSIRKPIMTIATPKNCMIAATLSPSPPMLKRVEISFASSPTIRQSTLSTKMLNQNCAKIGPA